MNYKKLLFALFRPISPIYSGTMRFRAYLYSRGIFTTHHFPVPIISVGNLTMGGTGKTPTVLFITEALQERGLRPAIISRGYGGKAKGQVNVVSDGKKVQMTAVDAGDEPFMLASQLPGVPVITGSKRYLSINHAINTFNANLIILDDGFQHLSVARDVDLVLFGADTGFGNNRVFPGGDLRESHKALVRADHFLITGVTEKNSLLESLEQELNHYRPDLKAYHVTRSEGSYYHVQSETEYDKKDVPKRIFAFCGIANPQRFTDDLVGNGFTIRGFLPLSDHQEYSDEKLRDIFTQAEKSEAEALLTTEKDIVKLGSIDSTLPLFSVRPKTTMCSSLIDRLYNKALEIIVKNK